MSLAAVSGGVAVRWTSRRYPLDPVPHRCHIGGVVTIPESLVRLTTASVLIAGAVLALAPAGNAQQAEDHAHAPHDHGLGKLGKVTFATSCAPEAGRRFERAMAVLHSFWWEEGEAAFNRVLAADSTCAMAYWGL